MIISYCYTIIYKNMQIFFVQIRQSFKVMPHFRQKTPRHLPIFINLENSKSP